MLELIDVLRAHGFRVFIVTGGGVEFVRAIGKEAYGVAPDDVVGSAVRASFERRDDRVVLVRQAELLGSPNEGPPKALNIQAHIGQRPIFAAGNSAGDTEMLEYAHTGDLLPPCVVVEPRRRRTRVCLRRHGDDEPQRGTDHRHPTRLGWTVVSMRDDWRRIFRHQ